MKIKILTFHSELNYGANLQAYALKEYLASKGHEVFFINFIRHPKNNGFKSFFIKWFGKSPSSTYTKIIMNIHKYRSNSKIKENYEKNRIFQKYKIEHLPQTKKTYRSLDELKKSPPEADIYIVGSDQIWSSKIISKKDLGVYFLDFGLPSVRKISYAASSGGEVFIKKLEKKVYRLVSRFNYVGIREHGLVSYLSNIGVEKAEWTPDPTFLINWSEHLKFKTNSKLERITIFTLAKKNLENAHTLEKEFLLTKPFYKSQTLNLADEVISPFNWILEISKSSLLITDSYHAVLFSIFTRTPFLFLKWGNQYKRDERVMYVLLLFGLEYLAIEDSNLTPEIKDSVFNINWSEIERNVLKYRIVGEEFLTKSLK